MDVFWFKDVTQVAVALLEWRVVWEILLIYNF